MTNQDLNRRFAELCGLCWHEIVHIDSYFFQCSCGDVYANGHSYLCSNPDFIADPRLVLREMKWEDRSRFLIHCRKKWEKVRYDEMMKSGVVEYINPDDCLIDYLLDTTGLLVKAGIEWLEKEKGK